MKIGIGIPTYNRLDLLKIAIEHIELNADLPYDLYIAIDGSDDGTLEWVKDKYEYHYQERTGACYAKNAILRRFKDYDYIFTLEDDVRVIKQGVFGLYIKAIQTFGIHHFNFLAPYQQQPMKTNVTKNGLTLMFSKMLGGCFSTYTQEVIKKVGAFNPAFKGFGYGHCEYTLRCARARLTSPWGEYAHLVNANEYLLHKAPYSATTREDKVSQREKNSPILQATHRSKLIYIPL